MGFTLIELLVVIGVLGILMAMALAAASKAAEKAKSVKCRSNQHQINLSYHLRLTDMGGNRLDGPEIVDWQVQEFGREELGWVCPMAPPRVKEPWINNGKPMSGSVFAAWEDPGWLQDGTNQPLFGANLRCGSYAVNGYLTQSELYNRWPSYLTAPSPHAFNLENQVTKADSTPVLGDGVVPYAQPLCTDLRPNNLTGHGASGIGVFANPRHGEHPSAIPNSWPTNQRLPGSVNISFFDGHSEGVPIERLWGLSWHDQYQIIDP
jgi:prepilin-type N-terminal cleavage/methylation domain-containing protein/prepilin-type processing-associated H-X9-DG protein